MRIRLNGAPREVADGATLSELLRHLGLESQAVAIEYNGEIVEGPAVDGVRLRADDQLEIVRFVGGG